MPLVNNIRQILGRYLGNASDPLLRDATGDVLISRFRHALEKAPEQIGGAALRGATGGGLIGGTYGGLTADSDDRLGGIGRGMFAGVGLGGLGGAGYGAAKSLKGIADITKAQQILRASNKENRAYQESLVNLAKRQFGSANKINENYDSSVLSRDQGRIERFSQSLEDWKKNRAKRIQNDPAYGDWAKNYAKWALRSDEAAMRRQPFLEPSPDNSHLMDWSDWFKSENAKNPNFLPFPMVKRSFDLPKSLSEFRAGMAGADIGSKVVPGLMAGGAAGLAKGLYEDPGYDDKTGKKKSRILNALRNAVALGSIGAGTTYLAGKPSSDFGARLGYRIGSKFGSDKEASVASSVLQGIEGLSDYALSKLPLKDLIRLDEIHPRGVMGEIGARIAPGAVAGGTVGGLKGLLERDVYAKDDGPAHRIAKGLTGAVGGAGLGGVTSLYAHHPVTNFARNLGKMASDKEAAYLDWIGKAARIKMAKHLLRIEDLRKQLSNFDFNSLTKAAMEGHSKAERLKYAALSARFLVEKQAFAALLSAMGRSAPGLMRGASQFAEKAPSSVANMIGGGARSIGAAAPSKVLSETGPGLYGRLNQALFPKQVLGQPGPAKPLFGRLNDAFFPKQTMKVSSEKIKKANIASEVIGGLVNPFNVAGANALGGIAALLTPTRTTEQQSKANKNLLKNVLVPGVSSYNLWKRLGYTLHNPEARNYNALAVNMDKQGEEKKALSLADIGRFIKARPVTSAIGGALALPTVGGATIGGISGTLVGAGKGLYNTFAVPAAGLKDLGERFQASGQAFLNKGSGGSSSGSDSGYVSPYVPRGYVSKAYNY